MISGPQEQQPLHQSSTEGNNLTLSQNISNVNSFLTFCLDNIYPVFLYRIYKFFRIFMEYQQKSRCLQHDSEQSAGIFAGMVHNFLFADPLSLGHFCHRQRQHGRITALSAVGYRCHIRTIRLQQQPVKRHFCQSCQRFSGVCEGEHPRKSDIISHLHEFLRHFCAVHRWPDIAGESPWYRPPHRGNG